MWSGPIPASARCTTTVPNRPRRRRGTMCCRLDDDGAPLLNVFGGKITTYRRLAESAMAKLAPRFPGLSGRWTARVPLPGGDFPLADKAALTGRLQAAYPFLSAYHAARLIRAYGTEAFVLLGGAKHGGRSGPRFRRHADRGRGQLADDPRIRPQAEDVLWRRSKLGLQAGGRADRGARGFHGAGAGCQPGGGIGGPAMTLDLQQVSRTVGGRVHIHPTSLTLEHGTMNVLLGPTLSGKTTLMRLMAGLDMPSTGRIRCGRARCHRRAGAGPWRCHGLPAVHQLSGPFGL
jgi:hypothetical protein